MSQANARSPSKRSTIHPVAATQTWRTKTCPQPQPRTIAEVTNRDVATTQQVALNARGTLMSLLHATTTVLDYTASLRLCTHAILTVAQEKTLAKGHCARMRVPGSALVHASADVDSSVSCLQSFPPAQAPHAARCAITMARVIGDSLAVGCIWFRDLPVHFGLPTRKKQHSSAALPSYWDLHPPRVTTPSTRRCFSSSFKGSLISVLCCERHCRSQLVTLQVSTGAAAPQQSPPWHVMWVQNV